jgi:hypothetical protein
MKKKLLLHVGYPKTATTTIQESLFYPLHQNRKINYLGCLRFQNDKSFIDVTSKTRSDFLQSKKLDLQYLDECSAEGMLNVLSDEKFLLNKFYLNIQHNSNYSFFEFVQDSLRDLQSKFDLQILVTVRNQTDLIFSQFIQKFDYVYQEYKIKSFDHFIDKFFYMIQEYYDYSKLERALVNHISSENIKWLFFEDFVSRGKSSNELLASLLNCTQEELLNALETNYRERKTNSKKDIDVNVKIHKSPFSYFLKYEGNSNSKINKISRRLFYNSSLSVLKPDIVQREKIKVFFKDSNKIFFEKVNPVLNKDVLGEYF